MSIDDWITKTKARERAESMHKPQRDMMRDLILSGFTYDPGHSDLDDEQPIDVRMTLGDYRKVRNMR